ncbi:MAG TPA: hypothetical protein VGW80_07745 [Solirubrobacterales bacterium]|nr:hypothetical protein [Solirubrobacterales bacterium]
MAGFGVAVTAPGATAEIAQKESLRVAFEGGIAPRALPRHGEAPVAVTLGGTISTTDGSAPPQLRTISLAINRNGRLDYRGLPACHYHQIQPASTREAIEACRRSLVGGGQFRANVVLPEQSPFPSSGKVIAFNGILHGRRVVFAHIYGTAPLPQSRVLAFELGRAAGGYRTTLTAELPRVAADWGYVSSVSLTLQRRFRYRGRPRSFLSASCPAPSKFTLATFPLARASFGFEDGRVLTATLVRSCKVLGS